jgi:hypothetical protein
MSTKIYHDVPYLVVAGKGQYWSVSWNSDELYQLGLTPNRSDATSFYITPYNRNVPELTMRPAGLYHMKFFNTNGVVFYATPFKDFVSFEHYDIDEEKSTVMRFTDNLRHRSWFTNFKFTPEQLTHEEAYINNTYEIREKDNFQIHFIHPLIGLGGEVVNLTGAAFSRNPLLATLHQFERANA